MYIYILIYANVCTLKHWCFGSSVDISNGKSFLSICGFLPTQNAGFPSHIYHICPFQCGESMRIPRWCLPGRLTTASGPWAPAVCSWKPGSFEPLRSWETPVDRPPSTSSRRSANSFPTTRRLKIVGCFTKKISGLRWIKHQTCR